MKRFLIPALAATVALAACSKDELKNQAPAGPVNMTAPTRGPVVNFNYTLTKDANGDYFCPTPKSDCSRIAPPASGMFDPIDEAIANGTVATFFNTPGWANDFPYLQDQPALVNGLRDGTYTMVRRVTGENIFYIVVRPFLGDDFDMSEAVYTTMVDATL